MRILHVYNAANVAGVIGKYQRKLGHTVTVVQNGVLDAYRWVDYDPSIINTSNVVEWAWSHRDEFDLFHVHALPHWILRKPSVDPTSIEKHNMSMVAEGKGLILHIHGSDSGFLTPEIESACDEVLVSTPNLWVEGRTYIPNPIDLEMWPRKEHSGNRAFWFKQWDDDEYNTCEIRVMEHAMNLGVNLKIINRWKDYLPYMKMPEFYSNYDKMIEFKPVDYKANTDKGLTLGLSALEALASGLQVFFVGGLRWLTEFPNEHEASRVVEELDKLYAAL